MTTLQNKRKVYNANPKLKGAGVPIEYTPELAREYKKCSEDIVYFCENYIKIVALGKGVVLFRPRKYQIDMINNVKNNRFVIASWPRQSGKCLSVNTFITLRNKKTGEEKCITIGEFYEMQKNKNKIKPESPSDT